MADFVAKIYSLLEEHKINEDAIVRKYGIGKLVGGDAFLHKLTGLFIKEGIDAREKVFTLDGSNRSADREYLNQVFSGNPDLQNQVSLKGMNFLIRHPGVGESLFNSTQGISDVSDMATKKSLVLSTNWISIFPGILSCSQFKKRDDEYDFNPNYLLHLVRFKKIILEKRMGMAIPEYALSTYDPEDGGYGDMYTRDPLGIHTSQDEKMPSNVYVVDMRSEVLKKYFAEQSVMGIDVLLPQVSHLSVDTLLKLRDDEFEKLLKFHRAINDFLIKSSEISSEKKLLEMLLWVDAEVRDLNARFEILKRKRAFEGKKLMMGMVGLTLCLFAPAEVIKYIAALFSAKKMTDIAEFTFERKIHYSELEDSPFFLPWKLTKLSK